jgi:pyrroloquinoline quinone biosynthesis protein B
LLPTLESYLAVRWTEVVNEAPIRILGREWEDLELEVEGFEVAGDPPLYYRGDGSGPAAVSMQATPPSAFHPATASGSMTTSGTRTPGSTIGVRVRSRGSSAALIYVPGAGAADAAILAGVGPEDVLLWDGTFWTNEELVRLGISERRATDMGHLPISGPGGSLERLRDVRARRKAYIHINNTNPILRAGSPERRAVEAGGWEVAFDGMEFEI